MDQILSLYQSAENNLTPSILTDLIKRALSQDKLYSFGELYDRIIRKFSESQELQLDQHASNWVQILRIFTYNTWQDYIDLPTENREEMNDKQIKKLKQLSLASLAARSKHLKYSLIADSLSLENGSELETFLVDSIYDGVVVAKLDTKRQELSVTNVVGRDVNSARLEEIESMLNSWVRRTEDILNGTSQHITEYRRETLARKKEIEDYQQTVNQVNEKLTKSKKKEESKASA